MRAATSLDQAVSLLGLAVCPNLAAGDRITILGVSSANAIYETVFGGPGIVEKVDYAGVQDGVALYLHGFIVTGDGSGPQQQRALRIARQMRSGVAGISILSTPSGASASRIALMMVCGAAMQPA